MQRRTQYFREGNFFRPKFPVNYMKIKKIGRRGWNGVASKMCLCRSATAVISFLKILFACKAYITDWNICLTRMHSSRMSSFSSCYVSTGGDSLSPFTGTPSSQRPPWTETPWTEIPTETPSGQRPPCGQTNTCENITLFQTSFADGNKYCQLLFSLRRSNIVRFSPILRDGSDIHSFGHNKLPIAFIE